MFAGNVDNVFNAGAFVSMRGYDINRVYKSGEGGMDGCVLPIEFLTEIDFWYSFEDKLIQK